MRKPEPIPYELTDDGWDMAAQLPSPAARFLNQVRADVTAAKTARTDDLIRDLTNQIAEMRAELAAFIAREDSR